jgi:hypothetical protein
VGGRCSKRIGEGEELLLLLREGSLVLSMGGGGEPRRVLGALSYYCGLYQGCRVCWAVRQMRQENRAWGRLQ